MNDRELLELAAKAAGISGQFTEQMPEAGYPRYCCGIGYLAMWNPLTDDGDALRLAVKLHLLILPSSPESIRGTVTADSWGLCFESTEEVSDDPYAATRRAIVRAAAEIGRAMP